MTAEMSQRFMALTLGLLGFSAVGWLCIIANLTVLPLMKTPPSDFAWLGSWFALAVLVGVGVGVAMGAL